VKGPLLALALAPAFLGWGGPVMAHFTTCSQLTQGLYPADTTTWFEPSRHPQIVLYAHMLFPLLPGQDAQAVPAPAEAWHPPLALALPASAPATLSLDDHHYAEAVWLDPDGLVVAQYGLTMPARVSADYVKLQGRQYIPHTFAMTIGTKDLRAGSGQKLLPLKAGQYHARLYVDGEIEGIAFFRMLVSGEAKPALDKLGYEKTSPLPLSATAGDQGAFEALRNAYHVLTQTGRQAP
jgi:hypothetical protein